MTAPAVIDDAVEPFLELAIRSDGPAAVRLALDLLDRGATTEAVIVDVLAAAQRESGQRWLRNDWTVADEHVVSGVAQRTLDAVANTASARNTAGAVVVACAEGDWHSLPSQMFAEILRSHGYQVTFLGASTPAEHLARLLTRDRPDALIVSCNLPLFFGGVTRLADAAHGTGVPVIAGGRALTSESRAMRLGADAWASDLTGALGTLRDWADRPPAHPGSTSSDLLVRRLEIEGPALAEGALETMMDTHPHMRGFNAEQLDRTREDLESIVRFIAAARLVDDVTVLTDFLDWLTELLTARGVPVAALVAGIQALAPGVDAIDAAAGELARYGLRHLAERP